MSKDEVRDQLREKIQDIIHDEIQEGINDYIDSDGAYWMGRQVTEKVFWPKEKPGWTSAAVILAYDALHNFSKGSKIFLDDHLI